MKQEQCEPSLGFLQARNKQESESCSRHELSNSSSPTLPGHATIQLRSDVSELELAQILHAKGKVSILTPTTRI